MDRRYAVSFVNARKKGPPVRAPAAQLCQICDFVIEGHAPGSPCEIGRLASAPLRSKANLVIELDLPGYAPVGGFWNFLFKGQRQVGLSVLSFFQPSIYPIPHAVDLCGAGPIRMRILVLAIIDPNAAAEVFLLVHFHFSLAHDDRQRCCARKTPRHVKVQGRGAEQISVHPRPRPSRRAHCRHGSTTSGSPWLRRRNSASNSPSHVSSVVKPAPFLRAFTSATSGASSRPKA